MIIGYEIRGGRHHNFYKQREAVHTVSLISLL